MWRSGCKLPRNNRVVYLLRAFVICEQNLTELNQTKTPGEKSNQDLQLVMMAKNRIQAPKLRMQKNWTLIYVCNLQSPFKWRQTVIKPFPKFHTKVSKDWREVHVIDVS